MKKAVVFDFNGTLIWDTHLHNMAWDLFLKDYHFTLTDEEKHRRIHGRLNSEILQDLFDHQLSAEEVERYILEKEYCYQKLFKQEVGFGFATGVVEMFERLKQEGIPFVIATASGIENVSFYVRELNLLKWFKPEHIIYNDGTMRGKPHPDLFLKAIEVLGMDAQDVVIFEDSVSGILAAEASGAGQVIIVDSCHGDYEPWVGKHPIIKGFNEVFSTDSPVLLLQ